MPLLSSACSWKHPLSPHLSVGSPGHFRDHARGAVAAASTQTAGRRGQGSEITVAKPMHLKSKHTTLSPYAKIVTSRSLASGTLAHHPLHRTQRRRRELGRRTASRESADSLPPRATLFLTTSNFSEEPGLAPPPEAIEHPPLQAAIGTDRVSRLEGHTAIKARGCALVLNYRN